MGILLNKDQIEEIEEIIGYVFKNKSLLVNAFTHSSYAHIKAVKSNERLEFLGDTLLSTIISEKIYADMDYNEGQLSKLRSRIVSMQPLALLIENMGLSKYLLYIGSLTDNMKADLMEAVIGAIYIDGGSVATKNFIHKHFGETVKAMEKLNVLADSKSALQERFKNDQVKYTSSKSGTDHNPTFTAVVLINGVVCGRGEGSTKKQAEMRAASECLKNINKV